MDSKRYFRLVFGGVLLPGKVPTRTITADTKIVQNPTRKVLWPVKSILLA